MIESSSVDVNGSMLFCSVFGIVLCLVLRWDGSGAWRTLNDLERCEKAGQKVIAVAVGSRCVLGGKSSNEVKSGTPTTSHLP